MLRGLVWISNFDQPVQRIVNIGCCPPQRVNIGRLVAVQIVGGSADMSDCVRDIGQISQCIVAIDGFVLPGVGLAQHAIHIVIRESRDLIQGINYFQQVST